MLSFQYWINMLSASSSFIGTTLIDIDHTHLEQTFQMEGSLEIMMVKFLLL